MTTIEKIKARHPCEEVKFPVYEYYGCDKTVSGVRLFPEPSPGEVLTEEWARYYINIKTSLEWRNKIQTDEPWRKMDACIPNTFYAHNSYRLPLSIPNLRNITPEELPYIFDIMWDRLAHGYPSRREWYSERNIKSRVEEGAKWSVDGVTWNSFQVPVSPDNGE